MRPYLDSYIDSLTDRRRTRVSSILESARVSRASADALAGALSTRREFDSTNLNRSRVNSVIRSANLQQSTSSIATAVNEMYDVSNMIADMINSHAAIMLSDLRAAEKEVEAMSKMVDNFTFLLSDSQAYDFGYLETFDNDDFRDDTLFFVPDRTGAGFSPSDVAAIDFQGASLSLSKGIDMTYGLSARVLESNCGSYSVIKTDVKNATNSHSGSGWHVLVAAPGPVRAPMQGSSGRFGAQFRLEFRLEEPVPCSALRIDPMSEIDNELLSIRLFDDEKSAGYEALPSPKMLSRSTTIHFPVQSVVKFEVLINQPTFNYAASKEDRNEIEYQKALDQVREIRKQRAFSSLIKLQQDVRSGVFTQESSARSASMPSSSVISHQGVLGKVSHIVKYNKDNLWTQGSNPLTNLFRDRAVRVFSSFSRHSAQHQLRMSQSLIVSQGANALLKMDERKYTGDLHVGHDYYYDFGISSVSIGVEEVRFRGVFVSRPIEAAGDIGELRFKTEETNVFGDTILEVGDGDIEFLTRDSRQLTSIEYSVSNKPAPALESDWTPILPIGQNEVRAERLFFGADNKAYFRFPAVGQGSISIYRNGVSITKGIHFIQGELDYIAGVRLDRSVYNPEDIFTCDYHPANDHKIVSFAQKGFKDPSLAFMYDDRGAGEGFLGTGNLNSVKLAKMPYLDPELIGDSSYQPITVRLDSGQPFENLTDYRSGQNPILPSQGHYFLHDRNILSFNKPIHEPFRVYYQYLEGNTRIRVILRCNDRNFTTPEINHIHIKAKTRRHDVRTF